MLADRSCKPTYLYINHTTDPHPSHPPGKNPQLKNPHVAACPTSEA